MTKQKLKAPNGCRIDHDIIYEILVADEVIAQKAAYTDSNSDNFKQILERVLCRKLVNNIAKLGSKL